MEELGMPQGKQKLQHESIFFKVLFQHLYYDSSESSIYYDWTFYFQDANSLAYYNVTPGTMLNLQLKERGGRKK